MIVSFITPASLRSALERIATFDLDMRNYLETMWLGYEGGITKRRPCCSIDRFDKARPGWGASISDGEGAALCHNELSIARLCAQNALELDSILLRSEENEARRYVNAVVRQFIEEVEHAVAHCMDLQFYNDCKFTLFRAFTTESLPTRLLAIITLELREMSIRPRRLKDFVSTESELLALIDDPDHISLDNEPDCDLLALIDDIHHIRSGTELLAMVAKHVRRVPDYAAIRRHLASADARHPERPPSRCPKAVVERLVNNDGVRSWVYSADPVFTS